jgi:transposase
MQAYSMDLRVRVMADVDRELPTVEVAKKYSVSPGWIRKLKRFRRETGSFAARTQRVSHATKLDPELPRLQKLVEEQPDATLQELRSALGIQVGLATIWRALQRLGITFKKR